MGTRVGRIDTDRKSVRNGRLAVAEQAMEGVQSNLPGRRRLLMRLASNCEARFVHRHRDR